MRDEIEIRPATESDAASLLAIYRPYVEGTAVSFELVAPAAGEFAARIAKCNASWSWLVAEIGRQSVGYAYGSAHRERPAYRWSVETTVYVDPRYQRRGVGRLLYAELFDQLRSKGYCNAFAGVALPNEASVALHRHLGFEPIGVFKAVGRKFDAWHDVAWFQRSLLNGSESL